MTSMLEGIRVVEMANVITGPYAGMILADLGAEVVKVEKPNTGDPFRWWGSDSTSTPFTALNRGKKSVTVDVRTPQGNTLYTTLCASADVVIENFRPGVLDSYGVGYSALRAVHPRIVYCSVSGFGTAKAWRDRPVYDSVIEGLSGLWSQLIDHNDPKPIGPPFADQIAGLYTAIAVIAGLVHRAKMGEGRKINTTMFGSSMDFQFVATTDYLLNGTVADSLSRSHRSQAFIFQDKDGALFTVHISSPTKFWEALLEAIDRQDLIQDSRFSSHARRIQNYDELHAELMRVFKERVREDWLQALEERDVPSAPVNTIAEAVDEPLTEALGLLQQFGDGDRALRLIGGPIIDGSSERGVRYPVPLLGEHNMEVFGGLGYDWDMLQKLRTESII